MVPFNHMGRGQERFFVLSTDAASSDKKGHFSPTKDAAAHFIKQYLTYIKTNKAAMCWHSQSLWLPCLCA